MLDNLMENALHYTEPGSPIRVEWGVDGDGAHIAVLDRGPGLSGEEAERVFDRFYRGSASRGGSVPGTGLGLTIVETLARRWGAQATLRNRPDGGARAELRFPAGVHHEPAPAPPATPTLAP